MLPPSPGDSIKERKGSKVMFLYYTIQARMWLKGSILAAADNLSSLLLLLVTKSKNAAVACLYYLLLIVSLPLLYSWEDICHHRFRHD